MDKKFAPVFLVILVILVAGCAQQAEKKETKQPARAVGAGEPAKATQASLSGEDYSIAVSDQQIIEGAVTVPKILTKEQGWIVLRADKDGDPGAVLGYAQVKSGENKDVKIKVDPSKATNTLHAILHKDLGISGKLEYPGADSPITVGEDTGELVQASFKVVK